MNEFQFNFRNNTVPTLGSNEAQQGAAASMLNAPVEKQRGKNPSYFRWQDVDQNNYPGNYIYGTPEAPYTKPTTVAGNEQPMMTDNEMGAIGNHQMNNLKTRLDNLENEKADIEKRIPQLEAALEDMKRSQADRLAENRMGRWRKDNTGMDQWNKNRALEAQQTQNDELMRIENRTQYDNKVQQLFETYRKAKAEGWTDSQLKVLESQFANLQKSAIINGIIDPSEQLSLSGQMDPELAAQEAAKAARTEKLNKIKARIQLIGSDDNAIMKLRNEIGNDPELIDDAATLLAMPELQTSKMIKDKQKKQGGAKAVQTRQDIATEQTKKAAAEQELKNKASKYNGKKLNSLQWSQIPDDVKQYLTINGQGIVSLKG